MKRQLIAMVIILATSVNPLFVGAAGVPANFVAANRTLPPVVSQVLPVPQNPAALTQSAVIPGVSSITASPSSLVIDQNQPRTVIDWKSFNIGANSWVYFKQQKMKSNSDGSVYIDPATSQPVWQKQPDWIALNRIHDLNPSQIYGKLQADGKVYLINQNGILFGAGSQVAVHSLIASTLNFKMADSDFLNPAAAVNLTFKGESYQTDAQGVPVPFDSSSAVSNLGTIRTDELGSVFLLAPKVENAGSISSPMGQIGLVAGTDLVLATDTSGNSTRTALVARVNGAPGLAVNQEAGLLEADNGLVGMYGGTVQQQGIIRSITAVKVNGQIELKASELVQTGVNSRTETPPDTSAEKVHESFPYNGGTILIGGLESDNPALASATVKRIDHQGLISSPSGTVTLKASERALLGAGSTIDVSGVWLDKPASDQMTPVMLSSVVLRDAQQQKNGILLGQTVTVNPLTGSAIGDISGTITSQELTTRERSVNGGAITVSVPTGDIVSSAGSTLNFSGGGVRYGSGEATATWLASGNRGYSISTAPAQMAYNLISSTQNFTNSKYGITKSYSGLYLGGSSSVNNTISNYIEGADAGTATLSAKRVDLYGALDGHVSRGFYQNVAAELTNSLGQQITLGRAEPVAGTFTLGIKPSDDPTVSNSIVDTITVRQTVTPQVHDLPAAGIPQVTEVSSSILNEARLGSLNLYANNVATFESGSHIAMNPGSGLTTGARRIEYRGEISIPGGSVTLKTSDNTTPLPADSAGNPLESLVYIAEGSRISVAGQRTNLVGGGAALQQYLPSAHINGGSVTIADDTDTGKGVIVRSGSSIDAGGGYLVDTMGKVTGGNAGLLALQGDAIIIDGDLHGASLPGKNGGTLVLQAGNVVVVQSAPQTLAATFDASSPLPPDRIGRVVASADGIAASGFSTIDLFGRSSVNVDPGVTLTTSNVKLLLPVSGGVVGGGAGQPRNTVVPLELPTSADYQGSSSLTLAGGVTFAGSSTVATGNLQGIDGMASQFSSVSVGTEATLRSGPGGQINLLTKGQFDLNKLTYAVKPDSNVKFSDHGTIDLSGKLDAPGGKITVLAGGDVTMSSGAEISAAGYIRDTTAASGGTVTPMAAGDVKIIARNGALIIPATARIDVSGASPVETQVVTDTGKPVTLNQGSEPGSVSLTYGGALSLAGLITGKTTVAGGRGAAFTLTSLSETTPLTVDSPYLTALAENGFDAVSLGSKKSILFPASLDLALGRSFSLDAPEIVGGGAYQVSIQAPWVQLANSTQLLAKSGLSGTTRFNILGEWVDVTGQIALSGFSSTTFDLKRDMRLYDRFYATPSDGSANVWLGSLSTGGDLTLKADRIYPGMQTQAGNIDPLYNPGGDLNFIPSAFTFTSEGKITTLPSDVRSEQAIYSAGGSLTLNAKGGIENRGTLAAPLGAINLNTDPVYGSNSRVYLAEGSRLTTAGSALIPYGFVDTDQNLNVTDKSNSAVTGVVVTSAPGKSVTIGGNEIVVREGATIDISGGGSVYSYKFQSGIEGSFNPLTVKGRFVILPDSPVAAPGAAVYLNSGNGVAAGAYSILPEQYAFLPGAMVVTDLGVLGSSGVTTLTKEGYPVVSGFATTAGTSLGAPQLHTYSVRSALDVRREGNFSLNREFVAGEAGTVTVKGTTTILNGTISAQALSGSGGGKVALSGGTIVVAADAAPLPASFAFDTPFDGDLKELKGTLYLASGALAGKGFREIDLGVIDTVNAASSTATVTLKQGSTLSAPVVSLAAVNGVTLESGVIISAIDPKGGGTAGVLTKGVLTIQSDAQIHASDRISLDAVSLDAPGSTPLLVDHGVLGITGDHMNLVSDAYLTAHPGVQAATPGIYLTETFWATVNGFGSLELKSRNDLKFLGDVTLALKKDANQNEIPLSLTLDAARIGVLDPGAQGVNVSVTKLTLMNSGSASTLVAPDSSGAAGRLNLAAVDATIALNAADVSGPPKERKGDLIFNGFGTVNFAVTNDLALAGAGRVMTGGADLSLTAARVVTTYFSDAAIPYRAAGFIVDAGTAGTVTISRSAGTAGSSATPGGSLQVLARNIEQTGTVQSSAGQVSYTAQGTIDLKSGAEILARGVEYSAGQDGVKPTDPGGKVLLVATVGAVNVDQGARIDVSAAGGGDAGSINLSASVGGVTLKGELTGTADGGGKGGSLTLQTTDLSGFANDFSTLNSTLLVRGGFTEAIDIRTRTASSLTVAAGETVKARSVVLAVDGGDLNIRGTIDASGVTGGRVELYAGKNLNVYGELDAHATGADALGGEVVLGAGSFDSSGNPTGRLTIAGGSVNVSGAGAGKGGTVTLRAPRSATAMNADLNGSIVGAGQVIAEAYKSYDQTSVTATTIAALRRDTQNFMNFAGAEAQRLDSGLLLKGGGASSVHLQPGIELRSSGDLTVTAPWDLTSWRYAGESGSLTLRAAGKLALKSSISDAPTPATTLVAATAQPSWNYTFVAGSDLAAANPLVTQIVSHPAQEGVLTTGVNETIYTESGNVRFASGGDTIISAGKPAGYMLDASTFMRYSLATYRGAIEGQVGGSLSFQGATGVQAALQSATGSISLGIGGELNLLAGVGNGAIRTTGEYNQASTSSTRTKEFWDFTGGGDISVTLGGSVTGSLDKNAWDMVTQRRTTAGADYYWSPAYATGSGQYATAGLATMGGGNLSLKSGGDISGQVGVFGSGNLTVSSGGDLNGRFLSGLGSGTLHSASSVGNANGTVLEALHSGRIDLIAQGDVKIATIADPSVAGDKALTYKAWNLKYGADTAVGITSMTGDISLTGQADPGIYSSTTAWSTRLLPPTLVMTAARDITIENSFYLAPSATGTLILSAGRDLDGSSFVQTGNGPVPFKGSIVMGDGDPALVYGVQSRTSYPNANQFSAQTHAAALVAQRSADTAQLTAGRDIKNVQIALARSSGITAGRDISNLLYSGQNNRADEVSSIKAGRDISFSSAGGQLDTLEAGFQLGGPGSLTIQAGNSIDFGSSKGVQTFGNFYNLGFGAKGSDVTIVAGLGDDINVALGALKDSGSFTALTPDQAPAAVSMEQRFFDTLRGYGQKASDLSSSGDTAGAKTQIETARTKLIKPLFSTTGEATGTINMTSSQISTNSGADAINIFAGGVINVGKSTLILDKSKATSQQQSTGIYTANGGQINMLSVGNMNVNESRVMTFRGGDITMWSDQGGINAGRGSRTAINAQPPKLVRSNPNDPNSPLVVQFTPPAVGSGIAAKWYNKGLAPETPMMGNIYPFAPSGFIDAGEAGISGNKIAYYAPTLLNAGNFTAASGPAPSAGGPGVSLGTLSGTGSMSQATKSMEQSTTMAASGEQGASLKKRLMDDLVASWLDVKIISFDTPEQTEPQDGPLEKKRR